MPTLLLLAAVTALAAATKLVPAYLAARLLGRSEASIVGVGMIPRGEVGIVSPRSAPPRESSTRELFGVVVGLSILTTIAAPYLLRRLSGRSEVQRGE